MESLCIFVLIFVPFVVYFFDFNLLAGEQCKSSNIIQHGIGKIYSFPCEKVRQVLPSITEATVQSQITGPRCPAALERKTQTNFIEK